MYRSCPVCGNDQTNPSVSRSRIPILQNRVYDTREEALAAPSGKLTLCTCETCGFSYNGEFDDRLITYDEHYNNDVPSPTFERYAEDVARLLIEKFDLTSGTVYDVGCGKGTFLRTLCRLAPGIRGIGIDPSCHPETFQNFTLIRDIFRPGSFADDTKLVILRHVLEHITQPVDFLTDLAAAAPGVPLYVEVPEVNWIFDNGAFWDFCYEHCNYFTAKSLRNAMLLAGYSDIQQSPAFGDQYQWAIGTSSPAIDSTLSGGLEDVRRSDDYAHSEQKLMNRAGDVIEADGATAVWGMATKGVILSCLLDGVTIGIDINPKKQDKYAPLSGVRVQSPAELLNHDIKTVLIMNGNYEREIRAEIEALNMSPNIVVM